MATYLPPTYVPSFHSEHLKAQLPQLNYKKLGSTDIIVSNYSLGGGAFAPFYGQLSSADVKSVILEGLKRGVNYIDTAPWYGQGKSEQFIGEALKEVPRKAYYLATKVCCIAVIIFYFSLNKEKTFLTLS